MKRFVSLAVLAASATASADREVSLYTPPGSKELVVRLNDDGELAALVGTGRGGVVRCYAESDGVIGNYEEPLAGCFVAIRRDGRVVAPPAPNADKRLSTEHLIHVTEGTLFIEPGPKRDTRLVTIGGAIGTALGLWIDCGGKPRDVACQADHAMGGKFEWQIQLVVGKNGVVARPA
jgi:hypothetical protein